MTLNRFVLRFTSTLICYKFAKQLNTMKNALRKIRIVRAGKLKLFKLMSKKRFFDILNKADNVFSKVYTQKDVDYLASKL